MLEAQSVVLDQAVHKKKDDDGDLHQALSGSINTSFLKEISFQAIDDAEDEWSQHNAKKLIDTSVKGLRGSIPKDFPYFHVEFGLDKGFVNVIDDEKQFKSSFGLNVMRGMLQLPEEDMHRRQRHRVCGGTKAGSDKICSEIGKPFDWTKQLN
ncbi:hypothetical protein LWI28_002274 [Acer negundo]|uniref:Cwf19-like protein C-terminal domain-containing protein n=1 Tax=Acer negundo TaxID=4023 RepID=A0AAD5P495_ACENE|nr:hypothetical protein LWI28_002274 [Acer negundo]